MIRPDLNSMFAHVDDITLNAVALSLNMLTAVGLSPYARKRTSKALVPHPKSEEMGSMAKKRRLSVSTAETANYSDQATLSSTAATTETSIDGFSFNDSSTPLNPQRTMDRRTSTHARFGTPRRRSLGERNKNATRNSTDKSPEKKQFVPGTLIVFGGFMKKTSLSGEFKPPGGDWSSLPPIASKIGRESASYVHIGQACILISGGLQYHVMKRVRILSNEFSRNVLKMCFLFQANIVDLSNGDVTNVPSMVQERFAHASICFDGLVFVAGGQNFVQKERVHLNSVEK